MRIPTDIPLATWIRQLIADNRLIVFYKSKEWIELKNEVMMSFHYECQECLKRGRYTKADCIHHHNEVRHRPDLALSKYYIDSEGNKQYNLIPLCNRCHNEVHDKFGHIQRQSEKFMNEEKW